MNNFEMLEKFFRGTLDSSGCAMCGNDEHLVRRSIATRMFILGAGKNPADLRIRGHKVFDRETIPGEVCWGISGPCVSVTVFIEELKKFLGA